MYNVENLTWFFMKPEVRNPRAWSFGVLHYIRSFTLHLSLVFKTWNKIPKHDYYKIHYVIIIKTHQREGEHFAYVILVRVSHIDKHTYKNE